MRDTALRRVASPFGPLTLSATATGLAGVTTAVGAGEWTPGSHPILDLASAQLAEYFAGARRAFDLPLDPRGTDFQRRVWRALSGIPYGTTVSYGALARELGLAPGSARAVGGANARNPIWVIVPCHRVVGAAGALTGFAGGVEMKRALLALERGGGPVGR